MVGRDTSRCQGPENVEAERGGGAVGCFFAARDWDPRSAGGNAVAWKWNRENAEEGDTSRGGHVTRREACRNKHPKANGTYSVIYLHQSKHAHRPELCLQASAHRQQFPLDSVKHYFCVNGLRCALYYGGYRCKLQEEASPPICKATCPSCRLHPLRTTAPALPPQLS